jgi:hypothetical protein
MKVSIYGMAHKAEGGCKTRGVYLRPVTIGHHLVSICV